VYNWRDEDKYYLPVSISSLNFNNIAVGFSIAPVHKFSDFFMFTGFNRQQNKPQRAGRAKKYRY